MTLEDMRKSNNPTDKYDDTLTSLFALLAKTGIAASTWHLFPDFSLGRRSLAGHLKHPRTKHDCKLQGSKTCAAWDFKVDLG